jgi:hypothetical protein
MPIPPSVNKLLKRALAVSAVGAGGYGGYRIGNYIGTKKTQKQMEEALNNQQIANEYYLRGLQEGNVEKTAQIIAQELLKEAGIGNLAANAARWAGGHAKDLGKQMGVLFNPSKNKLPLFGVSNASRGQAAVNILKNPLTIGTGAFGAGMVGSNLMNKESSDESYIAQNLLEKIARFENSDDMIQKEAIFKGLPKAAKDILQKLKYANPFHKKTLAERVGEKVYKGYKGAKVESKKGAKALKKFIDKNPSVLTGAIGVGGLAAGAGIGSEL